MSKGMICEYVLHGHDVLIIDRYYLASISACFGFRVLGKKGLNIG